MTEIEVYVDRSGEHGRLVRRLFTESTWSKFKGRGATQINTRAEQGWDGYQAKHGARNFVVVVNVDVRGRFKRPFHGLSEIEF